MILVCWRMSPRICPETPAPAPLPVARATNEPETHRQRGFPVCMPAGLLRGTKVSLPSGTTTQQTTSPGMEIRQAAWAQPKGKAIYQGRKAEDWGQALLSEPDRNTAVRAGHALHGPWVRGTALSRPGPGKPLCGESPYCPGSAIGCRPAGLWRPGPRTSPQARRRSRQPAQSANRPVSTWHGGTRPFLLRETASSLIPHPSSLLKRSWAEFPF